MNKLVPQGSDRNHSVKLTPNSFKNKNDRVGLIQSEDNEQNFLSVETVYNEYLNFGYFSSVHFSLSEK